MAAEAEALHQWAPVSLGGEVSWDLRRPEDFDRASATIRVEDLAQSVLTATDAGEVADRIDALAEVGPAAIQLHPVGRNQREFVEFCGQTLLPLLRSG